MLITVSQESNSHTRPVVYFFERLTPGLTVEAVNVPLIFPSNLTFINHII